MDVQIKFDSERRDIKDRRKTHTKVEFPLWDNDGSLITHDRRARPDRRLSYIQVEWIPEVDVKAP